MAMIKLVERISPIGPDIAAVVNAPENPIPTRAYISSEDLEPMFGCIKAAADYLVNRLKIIPKQKELYQIAFLFGDATKNEKDIFVYPYFQSRNPEKTKAKPYLIKNGARSSWSPDEKEDTPILLAAEAIRRRTLPFEEFINTFPELSFHKYK